MGRINRTKLLDRSYNVRDARLFVIATEGAKTEKSYFESFGNPRLKVEVVAAGADNKSAPEYVMERLDEFAKKYDLSTDDSLWLVIDVDRWGDEKLSTVCREAKQKKYQLAISNPCFETWLCLHFGDLNPNDTTCQDFKKRLRSILGRYNSSNLNPTLFMDKIAEAIDRAKELHPSSQENWPPTIGSHVYRLIEIIFESMQIG
jgi:RloB-like protein